eukprot:10646383-Ditylum_brightwellii.AAC.2
MCTLYLMIQKEGMSLKQYLDEFLNSQDVLEQCESGAASHPDLVRAALEKRRLDPDNANAIGEEELKEAKRDAKEIEHPRTITRVPKLLVGWEGGAYNFPGPSHDGIAYTMVGEEEEDMSANEEGNVLVTTGKNKVWKDSHGNGLKCYIYQGNHYASMCNKKRENDRGDAENGKAGHMHLTTDGNIYGPSSGKS